MTLVVIGPVTWDLVIIGEDRCSKTGGATYFQSFVFEEFYDDYLAIVNCSSKDFVQDFPSSDKVRLILKDDTHYFINEYPDKDDLDIRKQLSNFAKIPILRSDLEDILSGLNIDGFVLNPLNRYDFPLETIEYIKSFNVPVFMSVQGFLRVPESEINENYTIQFEYFDDLDTILSGVTSIFLDEYEARTIGNGFDVYEMVITNGSSGSRIVFDDEIKIEAVECDSVVDTTGCGDTFMAAYISQRLKGQSPKEAGNFASLIASQKIRGFGPYNSEK